MVFHQLWMATVEHKHKVKHLAPLMCAHDALLPFTVYKATVQDGVLSQTLDRFILEIVEVIKEGRD